MSLFGESSQTNRERDTRMDKAVDALRRKYGSDIIQRGTVLSHGIDVASRFKGQQDSGGNETNLTHSTCKEDTCGCTIGDNKSCKST